MDKEFKKHLAELTEYLDECGWSTYPLPSVKFNHDPNATNGILTPTGHYDPMNKVIVLYVANRHPKDVLRSFAHEMRHHHQNLTGMLNMQEVDNATDPNYAQNNEHLRKLEEDAFKEGNMAFRDWADKRKNK
jgi:hypothetical protein